MDLSKHAEQILNIYNYYSGAIIVNRKGVIEYYYNRREGINTIVEAEILGKSLFEIYPNITPETSTLFEVMRTGKPITNTYQELTNYKDENYGALCNTFPVFDQKAIVGAIEIFIYLEDQSRYMNILIDTSELKGGKETYVLDDIVSVSDQMARLKKRIIQASHTSSPIMIYGETGTGKELVAQAIHANGGRSHKRFISQNCAAIPENLLESILFGTMKGGFTDAQNRMGTFEAASGGTLFLDEINSMDMSVQAKILKAVEEQKIIRIGGTTEIPVDIRIIVATNTKPVQCLREGSIREDLYYRLNVVQLIIPPLRERIEDIPLLIEYYIDFFNKTMNRSIKGVTPELLKALRLYDWPGNVRELRNMIEGGFNLCEGDYIGVEDIDIQSSKLAGSAVGTCLGCSKGTLKEKMKEFERYIISEAIYQNINLSTAAEKLGISRQTLNNKIKELGIAKSSHRPQERFKCKNYGTLPGKY